MGIDKDLASAELERSSVLIQFWVRQLRHEEDAEMLRVFLDKLSAMESDARRKYKEVSKWKR